MPSAPSTSHRAPPSRSPPPRNVRELPQQAGAPKRAGCLGRLLALFLLLAALGFAAGALGFVWLQETLPDVFSFDAYRSIAFESSRVQAAGGEIVAQFGEEIRTVVPLARIPVTVRAAIVCAEDASFYSHPGLDIVGIARALWVDMTTGRAAQGASTITQQFAKTRFLSREKTLTRKLKELVLARKLEEQLGKDEILTLYANEVYFGHGRYGVEEAARFYFGKSVSDIDVAQAALLAGVVNSPGRWSPLRHPKAALERRTYVLQQMEKHGYLTTADRERADKAPLPKAGQDQLTDTGAYFAEEVRRFVMQKVDRETLLHGGLRIEIALDVGLQRAAEAAVAAGLTRFDQQYKTFQPVKHYDDDAALQEGLRKLTQQQGKPAVGRILLGIVRGPATGTGAGAGTGTGAGAGTGTGAGAGAGAGTGAAIEGYRVDLGTVQGILPASALDRYRHPALDPAKPADPAKPVEPFALREGDLIRVSIRDQSEGRLLLSPEFGPQVALVAIEPQSRLVRALVGGDDFAVHPFDRAVDSRRQPGSTFKTFTYGAAIEAGLTTPDSSFVDESHTYVIAGKPWTPRNYSGRYDGKTYTAREALAQSINSIAVAVAALVGPEKIAAFAERLGIASPLQAGLPLALGASSVTPLELTNAYASLAAGGKTLTPILVTRIAKRDGTGVYLAPRLEGVKVLSGDVTLALTDMLGEVVRRGSGKEALKVGRPAAGKTGTSNGGRDAWFVGFTPELCTGVWLGYDDRKPIAKASGGALAVPIWVDFMKKGLERVPVQPLPRLPHVLAGPLGKPLPVPAGDPELGAQDLDDAQLAPEETVPTPHELPPVPKLREDRE